MKNALACCKRRLWEAKLDQGRRANASAKKIDAGRMTWQGGGIGRAPLSYWFARNSVEDLRADYWIPVEGSGSNFFEFEAGCLHRGGLGKRGGRKTRLRETDKKKSASQGMGAVRSQQQQRVTEDISHYGYQPRVLRIGAAGCRLKGNHCH